MKFLNELFFFLLAGHFRLSLDNGAGASGGAGGGGGDAGAAGNAAGAGGQSNGGNGAAAGAAAGAGSGAGAAAAATGAHLGAYIDDKGGFKPGWTKAYGLPDTLEAKFTSPEALLKSYTSLERMLGNQNKVAIPGPNATPEERAAFFKAIGRPEKPEEYGVKMPEKLGDKPFPKELWNEERANGFTKLAHELGLTKEQAAKLAEFDLSNGVKSYESVTAAQQKAIADATAALKAEWGADYAKNLELAQKAAKQAGGDDLLTHPLANDPTFIKAMAKVGAMIVEEPGGAAGARGTSHVKSDPKQEINAIRADKNHPYHVKGHPQHDAAVKQMAALYEAAFPTAKA
jgi:hypothetical protein